MFVRQRGSVSLKQDLTVSNDALFGTLRLASIPATLPSLPHLITPFCARHPGVNVQVQSLSSIAIQRAMDDLEIDVGVTYLDNEPLKRVRCHHLYRERLASDLRTLPLVKPVCTHSIGLVVSDRDPLTPIANALLRYAAASISNAL
jgi:LysR substrate binding domain